MPRLPTGKRVWLSCHVSIDRTSRLASDKRWAALGYPRRECFRGTHSQFIAVRTKSENPGSHLSEGRLDCREWVRIALRSFHQSRAIAFTFDDDRGEKALECADGMNNSSRFLLAYCY